MGKTRRKGGVTKGKTRERGRCKGKTEERERCAADDRGGDVRYKKDKEKREK